MFFLFLSYVTSTKIDDSYQDFSDENHESKYKKPGKQENTWDSLFHQQKQISQKFRHKTLPVEPEIYDSDGKSMSQIKKYQRPRKAEDTSSDEYDKYEIKDNVDQKKKYEEYDNDEEPSSTRKTKKSDDLKKQTEIRKLPPNTHLEGGEIVCDEGYLSDGIVDARGCWKCTPACPSNSKCGITGICFVPIPSILSATKKKGLSSTKIFVMYDVPSGKFTSTKGFCKVGNESYPANFIDSESIQCSVPNSVDSSLVEISFDQNSWSKPQVLIKKTQIIIIVGISIFALVLIGMIYVFFFRKKDQGNQTLIYPSQSNYSSPMAYFPKLEKQ